VVVREPEQNREIITDVSGPDEEDWVVFIEDHMGSRTFSIRAIQMDGSSEHLLYTGPGDSLWDNPISKVMLAPKGGSIAFLSQPVKQFAGPVISGPIEIVDFKTGQRRNTGVLAADKGLSWFPDGKQLAYVQPGSPERIYILNVETGENKLFHNGSRPLVSTEGSSVLVEADDQQALIEAASGNAREVTWPGNWLGPIALIGDDMLLYWGFPTTGAIPAYTKYGSPLVAHHAMGTLKLTRLGTGQFQTVVSYVDPRDRLSYGISRVCP
jgi:hypothetical protein